MSNVVIKVENLSKLYHLGTIGYGTIQDDLKSWWAHVRGKEDPNTQIGKQSRIGRHGEFWALRDVSFDINQGDRVGIIGRNGAGKSTLLKVLSRITAPTQGAIKVRGRIASLLEVGTGFHPELTGRENVFLNGAILGMKRREIQKKLDEIVEFAGISDFIDTPVKRYSSGMYVRLAFSVAAHLDSDVLILDEVLAVGDAEFQKKCLGKMEDVSKGQGRTLLFVSHNIYAIRNLCNKTVFLKSGSLYAQGDTNEITNQYMGELGSTQLVDFSIIKPEIDSGDIRFESMVLENSKEPGRYVIEKGQPIRMKVGFTVQRPIQRLMLSFTLSTIENITVLATPSDRSCPFPYAEVGSYEATVEFSAPLRDTSYLLHMGADSGNTCIWWKAYLAGIDVESENHDSRLTGLFDIPSTWTITKQVKLK